jgi:hypothetical protein
VAIAAAVQCVVSPCGTFRNNRSPNADLSPELESRPFYSTSFLAGGFSGLASLWNRKVGIPFACRLPAIAAINWLHDPQASKLDQTLGSDPSLLTRYILTALAGLPYLRGYPTLCLHRRLRISPAGKCSPASSSG